MLGENDPAERLDPSVRMLLLQATGVKNDPRVRRSSAAAEFDPPLAAPTDLLCPTVLRGQSVRMLGIDLLLLIFNQAQTALRMLKLVCGEFCSTVNVGIAAGSAEQARGIRRLCPMVVPALSSSASVAFCPSGVVLACGRAGYLRMLALAATRQLVMTSEDHRHWKGALAVDVSSCGLLMASGGVDGSVMLRYAAEGGEFMPVQTTRAQYDPITTVAFSADSSVNTPQHCSVNA